MNRAFLTVHTELLIGAYNIEYKPSVVQRASQSVTFILNYLMITMTSTIDTMLGLSFARCSLFYK